MIREEAEVCSAIKNTDLPRDAFYCIIIAYEQT